MDEKEAEARPLMGTIFLVIIIISSSSSSSSINTILLLVNYVCLFSLGCVKFWVVESLGQSTEGYGFTLSLIVRMCQWRRRRRRLVRRWP